MKTKETPSLKTKSNHQTQAIITENDTENDATPVGSPEATPITVGRLKQGGPKNLAIYSSGLEIIQLMMQMIQHRIQTRIMKVKIFMPKSRKIKL